MKHRHLLGCLGLAALYATAAPDAPTEREWHTSQCVAALDASTVDLASQIKAGNAELRPLLLDRLVAGAAFIGTAYLQGERDEARSQALLKTATEDQKALPEADLSARQLVCAAEGARLFAEANFIKRAVVSRLADKRMKKLLGS